MSSRTSLPYKRLDIQGLRALAVIGVLAFHTQLPLPGGFAGVDVFFVISGYVITNMLQREWNRSNRISLISFWRRRFLRLTPALALVITGTLIGAGIIMYPDEQLIALQTGISALLLSANIVIARNTGGYFDLPAETNPLLNTWSLSVEEQFYLIFPLILILGWHVGKRFRLQRQSNIFLNAVLIIVSFSLALLASGELMDIAVPSWLNFYSPLTRAWEFAIGSFIALVAYGFILRSKPVSGVLRIAGLTLIAGTYLFVSAANPWPGLWTLLPVAGTSLVLVSGQTNDVANGRLLTSTGAVKVGDWSYSIYLWHWPFIVFAIALGFNDSFALTTAVLLSLIPALASYKLVEQPLRLGSGALNSRNKKILSIALIAPIVSGIAMVTVLKPTTMFVAEVGTSYLTYIDENSYPCINTMGIDSSARCRQSLPYEEPSVVILGDSHGEHLFPGFLNSFPDVNVQYLFLPDWPYAGSKNDEQVITKIAQTPTVWTVVLGIRWVPEATEIADDLQRQIEILTQAGKQVIVSNDNPYFEFDARECKYQRTFFSDTRCQQSSKSFEATTEIITFLLDQFADDPNVHIIDTAAGFCNDDVCTMIIDGKLAIADRGHLTVDGSRTVIDRLKDTDLVFRSLIEGNYKETSLR